MRNIIKKMLLLYLSLKPLILFLLFSVFISCSSTKELYKKVKSTSEKGIAIGHQDATSYGVGWNYSKNFKNIKSDINEVTGDLPVVYGFDIGRLELGDINNIDSVPFNRMRKLIIEAYKKGGIITISWHTMNPVTGGDSWDQTLAVKSILPKGKNYHKYQSWLFNIASFFKSLKYKHKTIPVIFRPYHEMNGDWFWWGGKNTNPKDYKELWITTYNILKKTYKVKNLLYAYSPNKINLEENYLTYYPGDKYVDVLGVDVYDFDNSEDYAKSIKENIAIIKKLGIEKNMPYAFTETGNETLNTPNWFTEVLYPSIKKSGIAWVLFWRNARKNHHYLPFKGHVSEEDFKKFYNLPETLFLKDILINKNKL